ncbi:MAG TPA: DUF5709 domain-containing protein [Streptosporangiaceae bacterium]|nr:DUF5709 domain-containing protein [Streptosporangiaceae bacterium]
MPEDLPYESNDLVDFEVLDATDTLAGAPGDDPLDRGVVAPLRWSRAIRSDITVAGQDADRSLDRQLSAEEPDISLEYPDPGPDVDGWDENATEDDITRLAEDPGPDPRAGRLAFDDDGAVLIANADYVARDAGADGGGATAEEAAIHVFDEES